MVEIRHLAKATNAKMLGCIFAYYWGGNSISLPVSPPLQAVYALNVSSSKYI
jgi:hypothetical protein